MQTISVVGLGKLGSPLLAVCASRGFGVIGVDTNENFVRLLNRGKAPVDEPGLSKLIAKNRRRIRATLDYSDAIYNSDITFIIVPTPSTKSGAFSNKYVLGVIQNVGKVLATKNKFHLVVVVSTVMPTSMDAEIVPELERSSGKKVGLDIGVCYNPEFIALGSVVANLIRPDFVLIGESDKRSGDILKGFYLRFCMNKPPVSRMNFVNAEIAKIALNSYITTKISFANTLSVICEKVPGGDCDLITGAIGQDVRVGGRYLKGGLPYGGPCFPRDNRAFSSFAKKVGVWAPIAKASDLVNEDMAFRVAEKLNKILSTKRPKIAILGLAYKAGTDVAEESAGVRIANMLSQSGFRVSVWDPKAMAKAKDLVLPNIIFAKSMKDSVDGAGVIVITTPWEDFKKIGVGAKNSGAKKPVLVDCWRILDPLKYSKRFLYETLGTGSLRNFR